MEPPSPSRWSFYGQWPCKTSCFLASVESSDILLPAPVVRGQQLFRLSILRRHGDQRSSLLLLRNWALRRFRGSSESCRYDVLARWSQSWRSVPLLIVVMSEALGMAVAVDVRVFGRFFTTLWLAVGLLEENSWLLWTGPRLIRLYKRLSLYWTCHPSTSKVSTGRRNSYTVAFKISVVEWLRKNEASCHKAAKEFSIDRKRVREWSERYDVLKQHGGGVSGKHRKLSTGRAPLSADLNQRVFDYLEEERSEGRPVSNDALMAKAAQIAGGLGLEDFKASRGWLWRWKRRNNVGMHTGTNTSQKVPADYVDLLHRFRKTIIAHRKVSRALSPLTSSTWTKSCVGSTCRWLVQITRKAQRPFASRQLERRRRDLL